MFLKVKTRTIENKTALESWEVGGTGGVNYTLEETSCLLS